MHLVHFEPAQGRAEVWRISFLCFFSLAQKCFPSICNGSATHGASPCTQGQHHSQEWSCSFLLSLQAQYQRGLTLCQEAAEVRDTTFPEADAFQMAAALFQTKLMSFSKQLERRQAERELLQELVRFSNKVGEGDLPLQDMVLLVAMKPAILTCFVGGRAEAGLLAVLGLGTAWGRPGTAVPAEILPKALGGVRPGEAAGDEGSGAQDAEQPRVGSLDRGTAQVPGDPADPGGDAGRTEGGLGSTS